MAHSDATTFRSIDDHAGCRACVEIQQSTWGDDFAEVVPASLMMVARKIGGLLEGAYGPGGQLLGFVFGMVGVEAGRLVHWSHMLAVRPDARGRGLGRRLKLHQRERLLQRGVDVALWTYDPLVSRNAHLNLNRLGAVVTDYRPNLYGTETNSPLHGEGGTDRFVVRWRLQSERTRRTVEGERAVDAAACADSSVVTLDGDTAGADAAASRPEPPFPDRGPALVEIPGDVQRLKRSDPEQVVRWRRLTRAALPWYLDRGYRVEGLVPAPGGDRYRYVLRRGDVRTREGEGGDAPSDGGPSR